MTCTGVVRGRQVDLEGDESFPEGTRVRIIPEELSTDRETTGSLGEWLQQARMGRAQRPATSDSTELLREMREERAGR